MKKKDEAFGKFVEWKKMVKLQIGKNDKKLRTNNGLEYCNNEFDGFCKKDWITQHMRCTYTPQQWCGWETQHDHYEQVKEHFE